MVQSNEQIMLTGCCLARSENYEDRLPDVQVPHKVRQFFLDANTVEETVCTQV